jgi:hypothetical protein
MELWKAAKGRGVARRAMGDVQKIVGEDTLIAEARSQGFHVAKVGTQYVVFSDPIDVLC